MKLFYTPNSPYARIARLALIEAGIAASVEHIVALNRQDDNPVLDFSPVGRVPTLVDGGLVITEARNVVDYIAAKSGCTAMRAPSAGDWTAVGQEGLILGFLEGIAFRVRENRRGEMMSADLIEVEIKRCERCLTALNAEALSGMLQPFPVFRSMALASALDLMDLHCFAPQWQSRFPDLWVWFEALAQRPSMQETRPLP